MRFSVVTLFPEMITLHGVVGRAHQDGAFELATVNPRDFTHDKHRTVDDTPYGGGVGMVMKPEPLLAAIDHAIGQAGPGHRVYLSPAGAPLTQAKVRELSTKEHVVLVCGRYEGIDQRVVDLAIDEEISIGDFVLSGGELGALVLLDAVARYLPGVLGEATSVDDESFSAGLLEYPQYTRPPSLQDREIPPVLTSGNHAAIAAWRRTQAMQRTAERRPDLWKAFAPSRADEKLLAKAGATPLHARTHVALVHHPVVNRTGEVVTTALTSFDVHDLARSSMTYGLAGYHVVTPVASQRDKAAYIAQQWMGDAQGEHRAAALALVRVAASVDEVVAELTAQHGLPPIVVASSARRESFPDAARRTAAALVAELTILPNPMLFLLGTGWGLADSLIPSVSRVIAPIEGASDWNHLSVRSAAAILFDRMFGRRE